MPLKIDLRAGERLHVGNSTLLVASNERSTLIIEGTLPVIRERDFLHEETDTTPLGALVRAVQTHYLTPSASTLQSIYKIYFSLDSHSTGVEEAMRYVAEGDMYKALRLLRSSEGAESEPQER